MKTCKVTISPIWTMNATASKQTTYNDTQQRILDAAIGCLKDWGIDKTSLNDIAKRAGVTRPTVYSYFPNRDDVIRAALLQSGYALADRLGRHIKQFSSASERLLEAACFAISELPKEPYLGVITQTNLSTSVYQNALIDEEGVLICLAIFQDIFAGQALSENELVEVIEISVRLTLSLLTLSGPVERDDNALRAFLNRRLLPAAGLPPVALPATN
jgi:AcrR family transcriptional regulator